MKTNEEISLCVTDIQRFCMHDGPGLRTTVFLKGCPLHCDWCHNPETQKKEPEILFRSVKCLSCGGCEAVCPSKAQLVHPNRFFDRGLCIRCGQCVSACSVKALTVSGKTQTVGEIFSVVKKDQDFYAADGGLTVSGGEPTLQKDGLLALLNLAKSEGISTCIETCGVFEAGLAEKLVKVTDLFLFDIKDTDENRLKKHTGGDLDKILSNLFRIDALGGKSILRCILIPGVNMDSVHMENLSKLFAKLKNAQYIELLPYHPYGVSKAEEIGREDVPVFEKPETGEILKLAQLLLKHSVPVKYQGSMVK